MLLTKEVEVILNGGLITHLKNRGVELPMHIGQRGVLVVDRLAKIMVKVEDLPKGSKYKVRVKCECCGKERDIGAYSYFKYGGKYCAACTHTLFMSRENNCNWREDKTDEERINDRSTEEYREWSRGVLLRDNYTCQCCGESKSGHMNAHHLDGYNWCVEKRFDLTNGICLCEDCHENFHSIYGKGDNTKEQFMKWINNDNPTSIVKVRKSLKKNLCKSLPPQRYAYCIEDDEIIKNKYEFGKSYASGINKCCNGKHDWFHYKHYIWYDEYLQMSQEEVFQYVLDRLSPTPNLVICLENNKLFRSEQEARRWCGGGSIGEYCRGKGMSAGRDPITNEPLHWQFFVDYIKDKTLQDYKDIISQIL